MARITSTTRTTGSDEPLTHEEWLAQEPCAECGGRPGYNPVTGIQLRTGHTALCSKSGT